MFSTDFSLLRFVKSWHYTAKGNSVLIDALKMGIMKTFYDQSVEDTGVAFVKGANERNEFFEKINKE